MRREKICIIRKNEFEHSAKGSSWKEHKYIKKVGDKYIYANTQNGKGDETNSNSSGGENISEKANVEENTTQTENANEEFDIEEMANKVIRGEFGNGADRKELLGESYKEIQKRVNEILLGENYVKSQLEKQTNKSDKKESDEKYDYNNSKNKRTGKLTK